MKNSEKQYKVCCFVKNYSELTLLLNSLLSKTSIPHYLVSFSKVSQDTLKSDFSLSYEYILFNIKLPQKITSNWKKTQFKNAINDLLEKLPERKENFNLYLDFSSIKISLNLILFIESSIIEQIEKLGSKFSSYTIFLESELNDQYIKKLIINYPLLCLKPSKIIPNFYYSEDKKLDFPSSFKDIYQPIQVLLEELEKNSLELSYLNKDIFILKTEKNIIESSLSSLISHEEDEKDQSSTPADFVSVLDYHSLKKKYEQKSSLLYTVIHDIKSPLTAIQGFAELLRDGLIGPVTPEIVKNLEIIVSNSKRLSHMVESILEYERYDHKSEYITHRETFNLIDLLQDAKMSVLPQMIQKEQNINILTPETLDIVANRELILRTLQNILDNAVKFSPPKTGKIDLFAEEVTIKGKSLIKITIRDNGLGFSKKDLLRVFEPFLKFEIGSDSTGLGLSISKRIIEDIHGGSIEINSDGRNKGTTVIIFLPKT